MRRSNSYTKFLLILLSGIFCIACGPVNKVSSYDVSYLYNAEENFKAPQLIVYNINDNTSEVWVGFRCADYLPEVPEENEEPEIRINYSLHTTYQANEVLDSGSYVISDSESLASDNYIHRFRVNSRKGGKYVLKVFIRGSGMKIPLLNIAEIHREEVYSPEDMMLLNAKLHPSFSNRVKPDELFSINVNNENTKKLHVRYYSRIFPIALPPFAFADEEVFDYAADSLFSVNVYDGSTGMMKLSRTGFYHFQYDSSYRAGFTVFIYRDDYPAVESHEQMLLPMRYLTTSREFYEIYQSRNIKVAIDSFWLSNAGSTGRARYLIQSYYTRVEEANDMFASYHEGWKTDMGMIYIVLGPPDHVYVTDDYEKWVYGEYRNPRSIKFTFDRVENPFTRRDFNLVKSPVYKESWYNAVENWRR